MTPEHIFFAVLLASTLGFGGLASLPVLRSQLAHTSLPTDTILLESFAVGNVGPGPNALYLVAFGYIAGGVGGWAAACLAMVIPPVLVLAVQRLHDRLIHMYRFRGALSSLSFAVSAALLLASRSLILSAVHDPAEAVAALAGAGLLYVGVPPLVAVFAGAVSGILVH